MRRLFLAITLLCASATQAAGPSAALAWVAPTTNTDGTAITVALTYNVYQGSAVSAAACTLGSTPVQTGVSGTSLTITAGLADGTTACFAVTAVEGGVESAKSNVATKTFPPATPLAPALSVT